MRTVLFAISLFMLSCGVPARSTESDAGDGATRAAPDSAFQASVDVTKVVRPSVPDSAEACRACKGDWGIHSLSDAVSGMESCDCRTSDGGKRCTDGSDCQGMCIANADSPEFDVIDIGPPARGFLVGRCSEFVTVFGCNALVDAGARDAGPLLTSDLPPEVCVD